VTVSFLQSTRLLQPKTRGMWFEMCELQNIVERSVILCDVDTFWVDEAWLTSQEAPRTESSRILTETLQNHEKELIEAAWQKARGKLLGQMARLQNSKFRVRRQNLESSSSKKHNSPPESLFQLP
jgi:DNA-binding NtrC family response regulator